jgi:uncharacterized membrane protein YheB (UPF0754 family)
MNIDLLEKISGPIIGAIIGYGTNYIAVKMLFRPLKPVKIGGFTLPFTPGIIPKRKGKLGLALGEAIGNKLLTKEDIEKVLLSDNMKNAVVEEIMKSPNSDSVTGANIQNLLSDFMGEEQYQKGTEKTKEIICKKLLDGVESIDIGAVITTEATKAIKQKAQGTMFGFMINDQLIASIAQPIGQSVNEYVSNNGNELFMPIISNEIEKISLKTPVEVMDEMGLSNEQLRKTIEAIYSGFISSKSESIIKQFDIAGIVEEKINEMDVLEIEKLVLSVMENELNAIVNLGAVIGLILGLFMLIF